MGHTYRQKLLDTAKKSTADTIKTASKKAIQKIAQATGVLIRNKIADKITSVSKKIAFKDRWEWNKKDIYFWKKRTNYWSIKFSRLIKYNIIM